MTRITNFGRKRTYLETENRNATVEGQRRLETTVKDTPNPEGELGRPHKKSRKKRHEDHAPQVEERTDTEVVHADVDRVEQTTTKKAKTGNKRKREEEKHKRSAASDRRRQKRMAERQASTTCLACRKKGHAVKDCPDTRGAAHEHDVGGVGAPGKSKVGICYRCGSEKHNLSRCKKPANQTNPLPFASCFVCSEKGHLASSCPQNRGKGIYPDGGSCMLCGQTSHLAKDCELRRPESASKKVVMLGSTGREGGADEDDFHVLKRRRDALQREETIFQKVSAKSMGLAVKPKPKVVVFQ